MKTNMSSIDRVIRVIIAVVIATLYFTGTIGGAVGLILIALAAIFLITSLISSCPIYLLFGLSSIQKKISPKN